MKAWAVTLGVFAWVLGLTMAAAGFGLFGWAANLLRETPRWSAQAISKPWTEWPAVVSKNLGLSPVEFGLLGIILILLAVLTVVLVRGPYAPRVREREARDARMVQDLYRGLAAMEERLELLESLVLQRAGRLSFGRKTN